MSFTLKSSKNQRYRKLNEDTAIKIRNQLQLLPLTA